MSDDLIKRAREAAEPWDYGEPDTIITELADRIVAQEAEIERLRGKLREIEDMCPVTCDMSVAHAMADVATEALAGKAEQ